jgi:hypothetical protein
MQNVYSLYYKLEERLTQLLLFLDYRNFITFIWMVLAIIFSKSIALCSWAIVLPFDVNAASSIRRFSRWLHNPKIDHERIYDAIIRNALRNWAGDRIILALDTSMLRDNICAVRVSMIYLGRAIPIAWRVLEHKSSSVKFAVYKKVLTRANSRLPKGIEVIFLADRGFVSKKLMRQLNKWGWIWRIRIKGNQVLYCSDRRMKPEMLMLQRGNAMLFSGNICFGKDLGGLSLSAAWSREADEPWYILSNDKASAENFIEYGMRFDIEEEFRDEKSGGFSLEESRVEGTEALERLILVIAVATIMMLNEGLAVVKEGNRKKVDTHWERGLSYFQIGWRWISKQLSRATAAFLQCSIELKAVNDPLPAAPTRKESVLRRKRKNPKWHFKSIIFCLDLPV